MITYNKPNASEPKNNWYTEGGTVPIYLDGEQINEVYICFDYANTQGAEYEIADVRYGSIDGILMPEIEDIKNVIQGIMGLHNTLIFPDEFTHEQKL